MQIEGIEGLLRVYTCQLHKEEGQHSCFSFEALVPDGKGAAYLQQVHNPIKAYLTEESGEKGDCVFCGLITSVKLKQDFSATKICVCASSYSLLLDEHEKTRIFQDENKQMKDVLSASRLELSKDMGRGNVTLEVANPILHRPCKEIVVQNKETNFSFLKRCSRALHIPLWVRDRREALTLKMDSKTSNHTLTIPETQVYQWYSQRDFSSSIHEVTLSRYVELGYVLAFPDIAEGNYLVTACTVSYEQGRDVCRAKLQKIEKEEFDRGEPAFSWQVPLRLLATVTSVDDPKHIGRIQVHFTGNQPEYADLDEKKPCWLPYRSPYTGIKDGIVFLPDKGDRVEVTLMHGQGYASTAWRSHPLDEEARNVKDKYIGNNFQRRIIWKEKSLELLSGQNKVIMDDEKVEILVGNTHLQLDEEGLHLQVQNGKTALDITGDVTLQSKGNTALTAKEINVKGSGDIKIDSSKDVHLQGKHIKMG